MIQWMSNLFTLQYGPYFISGFVVSWGYHFMKASIGRDHWRIRVKWHYLAYSLSFIVFLWVAVQTQQNANCVHEFNQTLRVRSHISEDNDRWSQEQRTAIANWFREILFPPPDIAAIREKDPNNLRVTQWAYDVTTKYSDIIQNAQREQDENLVERAQHPLPEPTCGK